MYGKKTFIRIAYHPLDRGVVKSNIRAKNYSRIKRIKRVSWYIVIINSELNPVKENVTTFHTLADDEYSRRRGAKLCSSNSREPVCRLFIRMSENTSSHSLLCVIAKNSGNETMWCGIFVYTCMPTLGQPKLTKVWRKPQFVFVTFSYGWLNGCRRDLEN